MQITQKSEGRDLIIKISVSNSSVKAFETLISTIDEFLSHTQTATQTLEKLELRTQLDRSESAKRRSRKG
jgi:hypothetical protein